METWVCLVSGHCPLGPFSKVLIIQEDSEEFLYFTATLSMQFGKGGIWVVFKEGKNAIKIVGKGNKIQALIYYYFSEE